MNRDFNALWKPSQAFVVFGSSRTASSKWDQTLGGNVGSEELNRLNLCQTLPSVRAGASRLVAELFGPLSLPY